VTPDQHESQRSKAQGHQITQRFIGKS